jgi:hypothetical protein
LRHATTHTHTHTCTHTCTVLACFLVCVMCAGMCIGPHCLVCILLYADALGQVYIRSVNDPASLASAQSLFLGLFPSSSGQQYVEVLDMTTVDFGECRLFRVLPPSLASVHPRLAVVIRCCFVVCIPPSIRVHHSQSEPVWCLGRNHRQPCTRPCVPTTQPNRHNATDR